jgi:hypothetical protein
MKNKQKWLVNGSGMVGSAKRKEGSGERKDQKYKEDNICEDESEIGN